MRTYVAIFVGVFLAELGDKTQLTTLLAATTPGLSSAGVFAATAGALVLSTLLAVLVGRRLGHALPRSSTDRRGARSRRRPPAEAASRI